MDNGSASSRGVDQLDAQSQRAGEEHSEKSSKTPGKQGVRFALRARGKATMVGLTQRWWEEGEETVVNPSRDRTHDWNTRRPSACKESFNQSINQSISE
eukprot:CAMPEP_0174722194 /NCGR_PEP_ID=MMETSP1094-20130205/37821_1 /TAXON_ID=156173 /ORGANISM="Chrysochromulina brevifilum, Strain UTEX LB 985" /LENGTH=98 /DNA_ID=CAMNT_0015923001 /DNA_START=54 /DNA_END=347 /DNA_ORIENTATION=+